MESHSRGVVEKNNNLESKLGGVAILESIGEFFLRCSGKVKDNDYALSLTSPLHRKKNSPVDPKIATPLNLLSKFVFFKPTPRK